MASLLGHFEGRVPPESHTAQSLVFRSMFTRFRTSLRRPLDVSFAPPRGHFLALFLAHNSLFRRPACSCPTARSIDTCSSPPQRRITSFATTTSHDSHDLSLAPHLPLLKFTFARLRVNEWTTEVRGALVVVFITTTTSNHLLCHHHLS